MRVLAMRAADHDRVFALVSHLPHVLSFALVAQIAGYPDASNLFGHTGGGFRDSTRIAGSSPEMWRDICLGNANALREALSDYRSELERLDALLLSADGIGLFALFERARNARDAWLALPRGERD